MSPQQPNMGKDLAFGNGVSNMPGQDQGFQMPGMDQIGAGAGIAKDLYSMYAAHQGMGLAKDQLNMQKQAFADNRANRDRVVNASRNAFA